MKKEIRKMLKRWAICIPLLCIWATCASEFLCKLSILELFIFGFLFPIFIELIRWGLKDDCQN